MIFIKKGKEPECLTVYKKQSGAYYDGFPHKLEIRKALLKEQGWLCAYCMKRIDEETMTIEHYIPQGEDCGLTLDYKNMLGVCQGNRGSKKIHMTCDAHRGDDKLTIDPLEAGSIRFIKYNREGKIYSENEAINKDLNVTLNLNCNVPGVLLQENRKRALEALLNNLHRAKTRGLWTKSFFEKRRDKLRENEKYIEYCGILEYYLERRLQRK